MNFGHQATFPTNLVMRILNSLDIPKDAIILDPYGGTGTTGIVSSVLGFKSILLEQEQKWIDAINHRIKNPELIEIEKIPSIDKPYTNENLKKKQQKYQEKELRKKIQPSLFEELNNGI
ncbi:MAG: DNA methyltransferase [Paraclostridium sp.]